MNKMKAIIVDDELSARENLNYLIKNFCPDIEVVDSCCNVDEASVSIKKLNPDVIFLDIEMPQKNGFQLLKEFDLINFQTVFVTAYDQYAVKAFEVSALDYLLKPIDIDRLLEVAQKLKNNLEILSSQHKASSKNNKVSKISIPHKGHYAILDTNDIVCIEADRMYSYVYTLDGGKYTASKKLSYYEELFSECRKMQRVHRSWLANLEMVNFYSKLDKKLVLTDKEIPVGKTYKEETEAYLNN